MHHRSRRDERGQVLVVFALSLMVMIAIAGLSVDAGGAFAQRRDQQTAADLAALAAANDYLINGDVTQAETRARTVTAGNGFTHGNGTTGVSVAIDTSNGVVASVDIGSPHANTFLGVLGMGSWTVSTHAEAIAGFPDTAEGVGPFIFSIGAFEDDGTPKYQTETDFGETNGDVPTSELDMAWTNYGSGNVDTSEVSDIISGDAQIDKTLEYGEYIGQQNSGYHNWLFDDVNTYLSGQDLPVAVVDYAGNFMGWAMFHVTSADGGADKHVSGYFLSAFTTARLKITACAANDCPRYLGSYVLKLWD
jgi:Tfp pilus assembly protein PilX